jgi:deoxyribodipyrimidine photo-lyase
MQKLDVAIMWFRQDLRLEDNPALIAASQHKNVLPVYILDEENIPNFKMGQASRWWLHRSLENLGKKLGGSLSLYHGATEDILQAIAAKFSVTAIYWNRCYEPWRITRDTRLKKQLEKNDIQVKTFNGSLLWEPWDIVKADGTAYKVFTPFYRKGCLSAPQPRSLLPAPRKLELLGDLNGSQSLKSLKLLPKMFWYEAMDSLWTPGEDGANRALKIFLSAGLSGYKEGRNFPARSNVSRLSPHIHFGEVSPNQVWYQSLETESTLGSIKDLEHFHSELGWREFSYNLLFHFPDLVNTNFQTKFDDFPWKHDSDLLVRWQKGTTGYPIVDAGMRELWQTGYMHNRVRMVVGSFLVKNLLIDWREGERWFWDCLVDADLANNAASWQWVAGSGADAAPYFRIFNPVTQGMKFDKDGEYTRKFVPELEKLPNKFLFTPWEAPQNVLEEAGIQLGKDYPYPVIDLKQSRARALEAFASIKKA